LKELEVEAIFIIATRACGFSEPGTLRYLVQEQGLTFHQAMEVVSLLPSLHTYPWPAGHDAFEKT